jgi:hypothetical protein
VIKNKADRKKERKTEVIKKQDRQKERETDNGASSSSSKRLVLDENQTSQTDPTIPTKHLSFYFFKSLK